MLAITYSLISKCVITNSEELTQINEINAAIIISNIIISTFPFYNLQNTSTVIPNARVTII